jgi:hypothetical protein
MTGENTRATEPKEISRLGFTIATAALVLISLATWPALDADYNPGFERWIGLVVLLEVLLMGGSVAAVRGGNRSLGRGILAGALFGGALVVVGVIAWLLASI